MRRFNCRIMFIFVLILISPVRPALSWPADVHEHLICSTLELLPTDLQQLLSPYKEQLLAASRLQRAPTAGNGLNVHTADPGGSLERIETLFDDLRSVVIGGDDTLETIAYKLGELAVNIADLSDPLNTDEGDAEADVAAAYARDLSERLDISSIAVPMARFWVSPSEQGLQSAVRANHFYNAVLDAYTGVDGYVELTRISELCAKNAVQDIYDAWLTLWAYVRANDQHVLSLTVNRSSFAPGDTFRLIVSAVAGRSLALGAVDLYLALADSTGTLSYLQEDASFSLSPVPFRSAWQVPEVTQELIASLIIPSGVSGQTLNLYAVLVAHGQCLENYSAWQSDVVGVKVQLREISSVDVRQLSDEVYLFPAKTPDGSLYALPLRRWDLIFSGGYQDDPETAIDESWTNSLIPGDFDHLMVYLGRDSNAEPWGMEMTTSLPSTGQGADLRMIRFPEFEPDTVDYENMLLKAGPKSLNTYSTLWAKRFSTAQRQTLREYETVLLEQLEQDWEDGFSYQLEFSWSGTLSDQSIQLIDDGRENGASCTDYWLSLFEDVAGVCVGGTRISAAEFEVYFRDDPVGSESMVPDDFNPFPFPISMSQAITFGFHPVDPPPHEFVCNGSMETGVPIPDRLRTSSLLIEITPVALPADW